LHSFGKEGSLFYKRKFYQKRKGKNLKEALFGGKSNEQGTMEDCCLKDFTKPVDLSSEQ
jgi:hypothetical protein